MRMLTLSKGQYVQAREKKVAFETSFVYSAYMFLRQMKKSTYLCVMSYKLLHCQENSWCTEIHVRLHVSLIQPNNILLPVSGTYRTHEFSWELLCQPFMKPVSDVVAIIQFWE
jgi:hypothetical protein